MRVKSRISAVLVASALLLGASRAGAEPSLADRETARGLMDDGDKKLADGNVKGALDSYTKADALMSVPTTGLEVARTQVKLGLLLQARETLGKVLRLPVTPNEPAPFAAARKAAETLNSEIVGRVPSIQVVMTNGEPSQAPQVFVDGEEIPAPKMLKQGDVFLEHRKIGQNRMEAGALWKTGVGHRLSRPHWPQVLQGRRRELLVVGLGVAIPAAVPERRHLHRRQE